MVGEVGERGAAGVAWGRGGVGLGSRGGGSSGVATNNNTIMTITTNDNNNRRRRREADLSVHHVRDPLITT